MKDEETKLPREQAEGVKKTFRRITAGILVAAALAQMLSLTKLRFKK